MQESYRDWGVGVGEKTGWSWRLERRVFMGREVPGM
jgi:hypothetical protein